MKGYLVLLVLSATLLAQQCAARSVPRSVQFSDRDELYTHLMGDYKDFIKGTLKNSKNYLERSQAEINEMARPSQSLHQLSGKITAILSDTDDVLRNPEATGEKADTNFLQMILCFANSMIFPLEFISDEDAMELLDRNGLTKFFEDFQSNAATFMDTFEAAIKSYLDNLSEAKKIKEHDMIEWYDEFKNVPRDTKSRSEKVRQFFQNFKPSANFHF